LLSFHTKVKALNFSYGLGGGLTNGIATPTVRGFLGFQYPFGFPAQVAKKDESKEEEVVTAEPVAPREVAAEEPTMLEPPVISENIAQETITELENEEVVDTKLTEEKIEEVINNDGLEPAQLSQKEFLIDDIVFIEETKPEIKEVVVVKEEVVVVKEEVVETIAPETKEEKIVTETIVPEVKEEVLEPKNNQKIVLNNIEFDFDSAELNERSKQTLDKVLNYISKNPYKTLEIWGHTDFYGPTVYNEYLGLRRSRAVYNYFKKSGISKRVMNFDAFGERRPVSLGIEEADRKKNRRVEILVIRN
jgi:outer membrane protein OmpA-like peptidoglycan-associated protein